MTWRDAFLRWFGPGMLGGIAFGDWCQLLRDNRWQIDPSRLVRAAAITFQSIQNSFLRRMENRKYAEFTGDAEVLPPIFVLGHWRSGTTHLHNLLSLDQRFAFPNNYDALFPHSMLSMERFHSQFIQLLLSPRRPMDNIEWTMQSPQEDEFALCVLTLMSPCMGWFFPQQRAHYDRYLTFRSVDPQAVKSWQSALLAYCKRLSWKYKRPLVLKSPPHTGRIRRILEVFPKAKFVHVYREPHAVFSSTRRMLTVNFSLHCLQRPPTAEDLDEWILHQYREMHDAFFDERALIPTGNYYELPFEKLEADPMEQVQRIYQSLSLPQFSEAQPALERYVHSIRNYEKNAYPTLSHTLRQRIADTWAPSFVHWSYPTDC